MHECLDPDPVNEFIVYPGNYIGLVSFLNSPVTFQQNAQPYFSSRRPIPYLEELPADKTSVDIHWAQRNGAALFKVKLQVLQMNEKRPIKKDTDPAVMQPDAPIFFLPHSPAQFTNHSKTTAHNTIPDGI